MAVIGPSGVIGRIVGDPSADIAQVQLIIGKNAAAGALIERTRAGGVVTGGAGDPPLVLEYVSNFAEVREGDWVVTSGIDGIYPKGFPIGQVESAEPGPTLDQVTLSGFPASIRSLGACESIECRSGEVTLAVRAVLPPYSTTIVNTPGAYPSTCALCTQGSACLARWILPDGPVT